MGNRLQQILTFSTVAAGANSAQTHALVLNNEAVIPDTVKFDNPLFDLVSGTATTITVVNNGSGVGSCNVKLNYDHSIKRAYGDAAVRQLTPAPFVYRGAGVGGFEPVVGKMAKTVSQNIADLATQTVVAFTSVVYDSTGSSLVDVANEQFVIPVDGVYTITAIIEWGAAVIADGLMTVALTIDGSLNTTATETICAESAGVGGRSCVLATTFELTAGTLIKIVAGQTTGVQQSITNGEATIQRVG